MLVIQCRSMRGDCEIEVYLLLLHDLGKYVWSHKTLHLHCLTGNCYVLERWLEVFPRTHFGITSKVRLFDQHQIAALYKIEENRLLLESDAPYFQVEGWLVGCFGFNGPSRQYFSLYRAVSQREGRLPKRGREERKDR